MKPSCFRVQDKSCTLKHEGLNFNLSIKTESQIQLTFSWILWLLSLHSIVRIRNPPTERLKRLVIVFGGQLEIVKIDSKN